MKRTMAWVLGVSVLAGGATAQSLRERIEAARRAAEARGAPGLEERLEAAAAPAGPFDPATDPYSWPIENYDVPGRESLINTWAAGGYEGRVYATTSREVGEGLAVGTPVLLYEVPKRAEDELRIFGRAVIRKVRFKRGEAVVEAALMGCTQCIRQPHSLALIAWTGDDLVEGMGPSFDPRVVSLLESTSQLKTVSVMKLRRKSHPNYRTYYMSTRALGPYQDWSDERVQNFVRGIAWKGMSLEALVAMMGVPHGAADNGDHHRYQWGVGPTMKTFVVRGGKVDDVEFAAYDVK